jgi:hypothetical protein
MKSIRFLKIFILFILISCKQNDSETCIIQEWKVIDLYRNNFPSLTDTVCGKDFILFNKSKIPKSILDSVFFENRKSNFFSLDALGNFEIAGKTALEYEGKPYFVSKVIYLSKGYNIDQAILLWLVKDKGIYIQQENEDKKLYLLKTVSSENRPEKNTEGLVNRIMEDTVVFPKPPPMIQSSIFDYP